MIKDNKALSAASLAAVALLAEEESRDKSSRLIYTVSDARYAEMMNQTLAPKELGHGLKVDIKKRGNKWVRDTVSADM